MTHRVRAGRRLRRYGAVGALVVAGVALAPGVFGAPAAASSGGRGYELVTPADKSLGMIPFPSGYAGTGGQTVLAAARSDGDAIAYYSYQAFASPTSGLVASVRANREPGGWESRTWSPAPATRNPELRNNVRVLLATPDFETGFLRTREALDPSDTDTVGQSPFFQGGEDVYRVAPGSGPVWLSRPDGAGSADPASAILVGVGGNDGTVFFESEERLTPNAASSQQGGVSLYRRRGDATELVSGPGGNVPVSQCGSVLATHNYTGVPPADGSRLPTANAIAQDGNRVYFSAPDPAGAASSADPSCLDPVQLYVRDGDSVIQVSASQRRVPESVQSAAFRGASEDGSVVYFTSDGALTDDAPTGTAGLLYRFDIERRALSLVDSLPVDGVVGVSADGSHVYYLRGSDLYVASGSGPRLAAAAVLLPFDPGGYLFRLTGPRPDARVSSDGSRLLFMAESNLTSFDSRGSGEVYLYEDGDNPTISCLSCNGVGATPLGSAELRNDLSDVRMVSYPEFRNLSSDGRHAFFQTPDPLVESDDNETMDVYEWSDGVTRLVSDGRAGRGSYYFDSSADGRDVFFATSSSLVPQDVDNGDQDIYDARIGGGFPMPESSPGCAGEQCQGDVSAPPSDSSAIATAFVAAGGDAAADPPKASPEVSIRSLSRANARQLALTGRTTLTVRVTGKSVVAVHGTAQVGAKRIDATVPVRRSVGRAGTLRVAVRLSSVGKRRLKAKGRIVIRISVVVGGTRNSDTTTVSLSSSHSSRGR